MDAAAPFSSLRARQRAEALLDEGTFEPLASPVADPSLIAGAGRIAGLPVLVAFIDGHVRGGTLGVSESSVLAELAERATESRRSGHPVPVVIGLDTGGVRVEEGPRALAAASAVGVALARLTLIGVPLAVVISGPRGCFGATAVMAALPRCIIITENAYWGLTGPKLLGSVAVRDGAEQAGFVATSAVARHANGDADAVVPDSVDGVRAPLRRFILASVSPAEGPTIAQHLDRGVEITAALRQRLRAGVATHQAVATTLAPRRRDLLRYSLRGQWKRTGPIQRAGLMHAAFGTLGSHPALVFILEPEPSYGAGVGIEEAAVVAEMIRSATANANGPPAAILTFLFCQGHAVDLEQERFGLPRALAECVRSMAAARLLGHPIISVLGGGTYGAAYLAFAAPSHRVLALRGTSVAPMAPHVLQAFQALRGFKSGQEAAMQLAELIPGIRMVESVIRLPRVLRDELAQLRTTVHPEA